MPLLPQSMQTLGLGDRLPGGGSVRAPLAREVARYGQQNSLFVADYRFLGESVLTLRYTQGVCAAHPL